MLIYKHNGKPRAAPADSTLVDKARKENFAIFTAKGMLGHLNHFHNAEVDPGHISNIAAHLKAIVSEIKAVQDKRKKHG